MSDFHLQFLVSLGRKFKQRVKSKSLPTEFYDDFFGLETADLWINKYGFQDDVTLKPLVQVHRQLIDKDLAAEFIFKLESIFQFGQPLSETIEFPESHSWEPIEHLNTGYYWRRLREFWYGTNALPDNVIQTIDEDTTDILKRIGNPNHSSEDWAFKGLVMGNVQSGKTTNYSALICKAIDCGYKMIIVLAGMTNSLRRQTQERLDETVVGWKSSTMIEGVGSEAYQICDFGSSLEVIRPITKTTTAHDFLAHTRTEGAFESNYNGSVLLVCKKYPTVLKNIADWLELLAEGTDGQKLASQTLIIDDEADNASVNTASGGDITRINREIRRIIRACKRSSYVAYTATPFANIFIDPEVEDTELHGDDLFPRHFITALDYPDNYIGAHKLFDENDQSGLRESCIQIIDELERDSYLHLSKPSYKELLQTNHKSDHELHEVPSTLIESISVFFIFVTVRNLKGDGHKNMSMLINVSRFNAVQEKVLRHVEEFLIKLANSISQHSKKADWDKDPLLLYLYKVWCYQKYEASSGFSWEEVRNSLALSTSTIHPVTVNMKSGGLEYPKEEKGKRGKYVIAIGGLALSRGLTLEGLAVSYVIRNISSADTLLQTARWFGYRDGYSELCRIYLTENLDNKFVDANETIKELRTDLSTLRASKKTPYHFGLKVRWSQEAMMITAKSKMYGAKEIRIAADFSERHLQVYKIDAKFSSIKHNLRLTADFINKISKFNGDNKAATDSTFISTENAIVFKGKFTSDVVDYITGFDNPNFPDVSAKGQSSMLSDYIADRRLEFDSWDIAIVYSSVAAANLPRLDAADSFRKIGIREDVVELVPGGAFLRARKRGRSDEDRLDFYQFGNNQGVADKTKSEFALGLSDTELNEWHDSVNKLVEKYQGGRAPMTKLRLKARPRPILLINIIAPDFSHDDSPSLKGACEMLSEQLNSLPLVTFTIGLTSTNQASKTHGYAVTSRYLDILRSEVESDDYIEEEL